MTSSCWYGSLSCNCRTLIKPRPSKVKQGLVVGVLALMALMVWFLVLVGGLTTYDRVMNPTEDSGDKLLNCYIYGDGDCGPKGPWHGFINLF